MSSLAEQEWLADVRGASVREFFGRLGVELPPGGLEASIRCFANQSAHKHDDRVKSCSVNLATGLWKCHGCGAAGNAYQAALALGWREIDARRLAQEHGVFLERELPPKKKVPGEREMREWQQRLRTSSTLMRRLEELRGWKRSAVVLLGVGWDGERVVFPVRAGTGQNPRRLVGAARYLPGGKPKTLGVGKRGLFPPPELVYRKHPLFIVEGEADCVAVWSIGLHAVAIPGANSWQQEWGHRLAEERRQLVVLCDCDAPGRNLGRLFNRFPNTTVVDLDPSRDDGWDVSDLVMECAREGGVWQARLVLENLLRANPEGMA